MVEIDAICIFHQKLAATHHAKTGPYLVAEFPLDMIDDLRQLAVAADRLAHQIGHHLFIRGPVQQLALVAVPDTQHFLSIIIVAPALAP